MAWFHSASQLQHKQHGGEQANHIPHLLVSLQQLHINNWYV